ncbi:MFS transporter [Microbacterium karelineae]|uniref:MFS transporter n=1 Tax=Microbacterium karelineae TaxID=2654283 RepID=UPI0012E9E82F|nr:MFS transporter [Microbacterium karelineae]
MARINIAKLLALAALVPPVAIGLAQRAAEIAGSTGLDSTVAIVSTAGSLAAIAGALLAGRLADVGRSTGWLRWMIAVAGAAIGLLGLATLVSADTPWMLSVGWGLSQLGMSGAMAALRALLGDALPTHRQRGATVMVLVSYLGAFLPIMLLLLLPGAIWQTTIVLAVLAIVVPATGLIRPYDTSPRPDEDRQDQQPGRARPQHLPWPLLLGIQLGMNIMLSAYLTYHPLDIAARASGSWGDSTVRLSAGALVAGVLGLLAMTSVLIVRPSLLGATRRNLLLAAFVLAASSALRPLADAAALLLVLIASTGAAVGMVSTTVFSAALESAPRARLGRRIGVYSAVGPLGQVTGPLLGYGVISGAGDGSYGALFLSLAAIPVTWGIGVAVALRSPRRPAEKAPPS